MQALWREVLIHQTYCLRGKEAPVGDDGSLDRISDNRTQAWHVEDPTRSLSTFRSRPIGGAIKRGATQKCYSKTAALHDGSSWVAHPGNCIFEAGPGS